MEGCFISFLKRYLSALLILIIDGIQSEIRKFNSKFPEEKKKISNISHFFSCFVGIVQV